MRAPDTKVLLGGEDVVLIASGRMSKRRAYFTSAKGRSGGQWCKYRVAKDNKPSAENK